MDSSFVLVSGGVDSAVALFLARKERSGVLPLHLLLQFPEVIASKKDPYPWFLANSLGLSLKTVDLREVFEERVVKPTVEMYLAGYTPNPCAICNARVKFCVGEFVEGEVFYTGHYARKTGESLMRPKDAEKDQTYFLALVPKEKLKRFLFPLGEMTRREVETLARINNLLYRKTSSQDLCFVRKKHGEVIEKYARRVGPGKILDSQGKLLGYHSGYYNYTVGQRKGLSLPQGVVVSRLIPEENVVMVDREEAVKRSRFTVSGLNLLESTPERVEVQVRYRGPKIGGKLTVKEDCAEVELEEPTIVAPGQVAAFYSDGTLIGGGIIEKEEKR